MSAVEPDQGEIPCRAPRDTVEAIRAAERQGDVLLAYDLARTALAGDGEDLWLRHRAVLNLARACSTWFALAEFDRLGLRDYVGQHAEIAGLRGRLSKDLALASRGDARGAAARQSATIYAQAFRRWGGYYAAINAATMMLVAGERAQAREHARAALAAAKDAPTRSAGDRYYAAVAAAEAQLLLGDLPAARQELAWACALDEIDQAARVSTRRQLRLVSALAGTDPAALDVIRAPACLYFVGHLVDRSEGPPRFPCGAEAIARERLAAAIASAAPVFAVGALACGTDILCAEILIERGTELQVVLPTDPGLFKQLSVAVGGGDWEARFDRCLEQASNVTIATPGARVFDDIAIAYAGRLAMGLTLLRARTIEGMALQIALWDGAPPAAAAGTAADVHAWRSLGNPTVVVPPPARLAAAQLPPAGVPPAARTNEIAMLFADFAGYSRLDEIEYGLFEEKVLEPVARILDTYGAGVLHRNTWGDGLYLVFDDIHAAARCALQIRDEVARMRWAELGFSVPMAVRIGGHVGPRRVGRDPVTRQASFSGPHVVRAARIEPIAPPGEVLVTEAFAAFLAMGDDRGVSVEYVGRRPTAKQFGEMRLFRLDSRRES
jgi:hypothetical protein